MSNLNPYDLLKVRRGASEQEIEDAYDRQFDLYEEQALAGDQSATDMLERLNEARDALLDPEQKSTLASSGRSRTSAGGSAPVGADGGSGAATHELSQSTSTRASAASSTSIRTRRRSQARPRAVPRPERRSPTPYLLTLGALAMLLLVGIAYLLTRNSGGVQATIPRGEIVATVNNVPIYEWDHERRVEIDKNTALSDPLFSPLINNFQGITGTRMLDVLRYDALDKLVNLEIIQQQARKEGLYPTPEQQAQLIDEAKAKDLAGGRSLADFLTERGIDEYEYNKKVVENVVYTVMANEHMPKTGSDDERTEGFIRWFCEVRKSYNVTINLQFIVENQPCTSGLPTDLPLPGLGQPAPPEPIGTAVPEVEVDTPPSIDQPAATPSP